MIRQFFALSALSARAAMYYFGAVIYNLLTPILLTIGQILLWRGIFISQGINIIGGFSQADIYSYILLSHFLTNTLTWSCENTMARDIRTGAIVTKATRPISMLTQNIADITGMMLPQILINIILVSIGFIILNSFIELPTFSSLPLAILSALLGIILRLLMSACFALLCFFTTSHLGLGWIRDSLMFFFSGSLLPLSFFPAWLWVASFFTPYPLMIYTPIAIVLSRPLPFTPIIILALQAIWILLLLAIYHFIERLVQRTISFAGG